MLKMLCLGTLRNLGHRDSCENGGLKQKNQDNALKMEMCRKVEWESADASFNEGEH